MQVLSFCLMGKMAHFRKYYSNSTALSYYLPPVTTVKGILAGLLGMERDSYYDLFSDEKCKVAIGTTGNLRKITQTMNLLKVESIHDLNGSLRPKKQVYGANHTQNDTEWIIPENWQTGALNYSVRFWHQDSEIMDRLAKCLCSMGEGYVSYGISLALGSAHCLGWIENAHIVEAEKINDSCLNTAMAVPTEQIKGINRKHCDLRGISLLKEETNIEFQFISEKKRSYRAITENSRQDILLSGNGSPIAFDLKPDKHFWRDEDGDYLFLGGEF